MLIAALPLKECVKLPGIKDGTLFQKNVRQSLGTSNVVNKGIRSTILGDKRSDFFFFHNGVTALCNKMTLDGDVLSLWGLSIVNRCQSLNTILSCSETVRRSMTPLSYSVLRNPPACSATIWMEALRRTGRPIWRSRRGDDCRAATVTQAIFS